MKLSDFDYELPPDRIAQVPADRRDDARLFVHDVAADASSHRTVAELPELLDPGDLVVVNDTRVVPSRLWVRRPSGGRVELLLLEPVADRPGSWRALVNPARKLKVGELLGVDEDGERTPLVRAERRLARDDGVPGPHWIVEWVAAEPIEAVLERVGVMPLPPYIDRAVDDPRATLDRERYQTVFAREPGAVAAPTAGLHLTEAILGGLRERGVELAKVTLHVGEGTFRPVEVEDVREHAMHAERYTLSEETAASVARCRERGGRVVAVGTTSVRTLESQAAGGGLVRAGSGATDLFLTPGAELRVVDALLTNFHLPKSTLLMLVSAFAGRERILRLYAEALEAGYRFLSYGDAMLLTSPGAARGS